VTARSSLRLLNGFRRVGSLQKGGSEPAAKLMPSLWNSRSATPARAYEETVFMDTSTTASRQPHQLPRSGDLMTALWLRIHRVESQNFLTAFIAGDVKAAERHLASADAIAPKVGIPTSRELRLGEWSPMRRARGRFVAFVVTRLRSARSSRARRRAIRGRGGAGSPTVHQNPHGIAQRQTMRPSYRFRRPGGERSP
jgi:hypothetical protein